VNEFSKHVCMVFIGIVTTFFLIIIYFKQIYFPWSSLRFISSILLRTSCFFLSKRSVTTVRLFSE